MEKLQNKSGTGTLPRFALRRSFDVAGSQSPFRSMEKLPGEAVPEPIPIIANPLQFQHFRESPLQTGGLPIHVRLWLARGVEVLHDPSIQVGQGAGD